MSSIDPAGPETRRLHPGTVIVRALAGAPSTLLGLPALLAIVSGRGLGWLLIAAAVIAVMMLALGWVRWRAFTYAIGDAELVIADGVVNKTRRSIPLARIQDVAIDRTPLARLFGLATVRIETGGGKADEGVLDSVSLTEAERLRETLRAHRDVVATDASAAAAAVVTTVERELFAMPLRRVLTMGAFRFSLVWVAAIFAGLQMVDGFIDIDREEIVRWLGVAEDGLETRVSLVMAALVLAIAGLLGMITGVGRTILSEFGFRLTIGDDRFRRTRGLLTRTEVVVAVRRVQLALIARGIVSGRLGWATLELQTLGGSNDPAGRQEVVPFGTDDEIAPVLAATGLPRFDPLPLRAVSPRHVARAVITRGGAPLVAIGIAAFFFPPALFALALLPIPVATALLARRHHRYAITDGSLQVARGVLAKREWIVPLDNIVAVTVSGTWLQRKLGIATVAVGTAGARGVDRPNVVDIALGDAARLAVALGTDDALTPPTASSPADR